MSDADKWIECKRPGCYEALPEGDKAWVGDYCSQACKEDHEDKKEAARWRTSERKAGEKELARLGYDVSRFAFLFARHDSNFHRKATRVSLCYRTAGYMSPRASGATTVEAVERFHRGEKVNAAEREKNLAESKRRGEEAEVRRLERIAYIRTLGIAPATLIAIADFLGSTAEASTLDLRDAAKE